MPANPADTEPVEQRPEDTGTRLRRREVELPPDAWEPRTIVVACSGCQGHGRVRMSIHDVLGESAGLIADSFDPVIVKFYDRLFTLDPELKHIFPPDLLTAAAHAEGSRGAHQRDQLVNALVKVATLYGAGEREEVELDQILRAAGRSHAAIQWPDGRVGPPLPRHWRSVERALFETLHEVAGTRWRPEYDVAWSEAYDHAEVEMRHAIQHEGRAMKVARQARATADVGGGPRR